MFVQTNNLNSVREYFYDRLKEGFSSSELRMMFNILMEDRLGLTASELILAKDQLLSESDLLYVRSAVKRLQANEPFQYVVGKTEFCGLELFTDARALIPRPETEELVQWIIEDHGNREGIKYLDLCAGTGCIAIALKKYLTNSDGTGMELSKGAIELSKKNDLKNLSRVKWIEGDVLDSSDYKGFDNNSFDLWVSNPPYVLNSDKTSMSENVLDYEPHMALFVEDHDPLLFYRTIAQMAQIYLKPDGAIYFEIHEEKGSDVCGLLTGLGFKNVQLKMDLQGKERMVRAKKS